MIKRLLAAAAALVLASAAGCSGTKPVETRRASTSSAVSTSHPLATEVAGTILNDGGSAVDAAIAAAFMLNVAEPWNSGLGGGGFALVLEPGKRKAAALDFRETAPAALDPAELARRAGTNPLALTDGPLAAATPALWPALVELNRRYGTMTLQSLAVPAIHAASNGIQVSETYAKRCELRRAALADDPDARRIFLDKTGSCPRTGWTLRQPELARTLTSLSEIGTNEAWVRLAGPASEARLNPYGNPLSASDFRSYAVKDREPVTGTFMDHEIISMGPPSSGGTIVIELLQTYEAARERLPEASRTYLWIEAARLAFFDRAKLFADPDFAAVPVKTLTSADYALDQADRIVPGEPLALADGENSPAEGMETTHISVVDHRGMAVSMTLSINMPFGSGVVIPGTGVLLNSHMDDFYTKRPNSFSLPGSEKNAPEPLKRPLSSMAPTIVLEKGRPLAVLGSPGGSRIPSSVAWVIRDLLEGGSDGRNAVCSPRLHHQWRPDQLVHEDGFNRDALEKLGFRTGREPSSIGNVQLVLRTPLGWKGYPDCRGDGTGWSGFR